MTTEVILDIFVLSEKKEMCFNETVLVFTTTAGRGKLILKFFLKLPRFLADEGFCVKTRDFSAVSKRGVRWISGGLAGGRETDLTTKARRHEGGLSEEAGTVGYDLGLDHLRAATVRERFS